MVKSINKMEDIKTQLLLLSLLLFFQESLTYQIFHLHNVSNTSVDNNDINNIFKLLEEGDKKIELSEQNKNLILVLGNTGSGKSAFVHWMAGDDSKIMANEVMKDKLEFIVEGGNNSMENSSNSKIMLPELVVDKKTSATYYNCPGFSDTRSPSNDIVSSYFTKKLIVHANYFKIVLVIGYPSVRKRVDLQDFIQLMRHTTDLIKNIRKFENSIAIIVTNVNNISTQTGNYDNVVPDGTSVGAIADFLQAIKKDLSEKLKLTDISIREKSFINDAMKLIDILCTKNNDNYTRIGIFITPDESGPLDNITFVLEQKGHVENILHKEINYTKKSHNDFAYTISEKTSNDINILVERINDKVWGEISKIADKIQQQYNNVVEEIKSRKNDFPSCDAIFLNRETEAKLFSATHNMGYWIISKILPEIKNTTSIKDLANKTKMIITRLGISTCDANIKNISDQGKYLNFLQSVSDRNLNTLPWSDIFEMVDGFLSSSKHNIEENVHRVLNEVKNQINNQGEKIARDVKAHYQNKIDSLEFKQIATELNDGFTVMSNLMHEDNILRNESPQELSERIKKNMIKSSLLESSTLVMEVIHFLKLGKYLNFLKILNNDTSDDWSSEWIKPINDTTKFLYESENWYTFLVDLYIKLSKYETQKDTSKYNVENINDWGVLGKSQGIKITEDNIQLFLEKVKLYDENKLDSIKKIKFTSTHLEALNNVLRFTLGHKIEKDCSQPGKLVITGNFIKISDFTNAKGKILDLCRNGNILKLVDVFSLDTVFVDRDIREVGSKLQISIIAPEWHIRGSRVINLMGASGDSHFAQAENGQKFGDHGKNGMPGLPGGPGGTFIGIGGMLIDGEELTIYADGGRGGPGQDGGDTLDVLMPMFPYSYNGANGGHGGIGGLGGMAGEIKFLKFDEDSNAPSIRCENGGDGYRGDGGIGGCHDDKCILIKQLKIPLPEGKSGADGIDGGNHVGRQLPQKSKKYQSFASTVNNFKFFLRKNIIGSIRKQALMQFVNQLESNPDVQKSYDTIGLIRELQDLEKQFYTLQQTFLDYISFYQSLLNRISEYAQLHNHSSRSHKKALSFLYTATLMRISTLKSASEPNIIIDLENFLKLVTQNIDSLMNLQEKSSRINVINQYKQLYKTNIDKKVEEAENFIKNQITIEIDKINIQVENKIDLLVSETIELQKQAIKEEAQVIEKKKQLEKALTLSWVFGSLKIVGQVVSCLGPLGGAVGSVIDTTTQVAESLSMSNQDSITQLTPLPDGVLSSIKSLKSGIVALKDQPFNRLKTLLLNISSEVNEDPEQLGDTSKIVNNLLTRLQTAQEGSAVNKIPEIEQELKQALVRKSSTLQNKKSGTNNKIAIATKVIKKVNKVMQFGKVALDIYNKYKDDKQKIEAIDEAIKQSGDKIKLYEQHERNIYEKLTPMLRNMGNDLNNVASQLRGKSKVSLDVTQWQVQSFLKDIKLQMKDFTKGFAVEDSLLRCIEKLEEAMTTLINIYDRIQNYQEQNQLAVYIADISSPVANDISVSDPELGNAVNELELVIMSNLVLEQYRAAVNALKQQVFPFAHRFLAEVRLPAHLQFGTDFEDLVYSAVNSVEGMQSKIIEYKTAIKYPDTYISTGWFNRDYVSTQPFFVWENSKYSEVIFKLLSGEKVVVKANLYESAFDKDAIKFNEIGINFYSENSTVTSEVGNKLKGFMVSATHLGNSYYRYNDNTYIITGNNQNIRFSFEKGAHGEPVHKNGVYDKIKSGDLMLSPYAMWELQLINVTKKINFRDLTMYKDKVDLELIGFGSYVTRGTSISIDDVEKYYKSVEVISTLDLCEDNQPEISMKDTVQMFETATTSAHLSGGDSASSSASRPALWITHLMRGLW